MVVDTDNITKLECKSDTWTPIAIDLPDEGEEGILKIAKNSKDTRAKNDQVYGVIGSNSGTTVKDMIFNQSGELVENRNNVKGNRSTLQIKFFLRFTTMEIR